MEEPREQCAAVFTTPTAWPAKRKFYYHVVFDIRIGEFRDLGSMEVGAPRAITTGEQIREIGDFIASCYRVQARDDSGARIVGAGTNAQKRVVILGFQLLRVAKE